MIEKIIEFSIRNRFVVILLTRPSALPGASTPSSTRRSTPSPTCRRTRSSSSPTGWAAAPGKSKTRSPIRSRSTCKGWRGEGGAVVERVQFLDDQRDLRRQRRFLLRPAAGAGAADAGRHVPAAGRGALPGPRRHGPGADLLVHGRRRRATTWAGSARCRTGTSAISSTRSPAWPRSPRSAAIRSSIRSTSIPTSSAPTASRWANLFAAVARSNSSVGGRVIHKGNAEYLDPRRRLDPLARRHRADRRPDRPGQGARRSAVANLATVGRGPQFRRSVLEKDGSEAVGAVVMMRLRREPPGRHPARSRRRSPQLQPGLPAGVRIVPFYDRTRLIEGRHPHPRRNPRHEMIIASVAILLILMHFRSAVVICLTLPLAVLVSFILMRHFGIAVEHHVAVGHRHLDRHAGRPGDRDGGKRHAPSDGPFRPASGSTGDTREIVIPACRTVGRPIFFSVMIILLSFIPVFALTGQEGKTFHPLAFTKSFAMIGVAVLSITLVPALIPTLHPRPPAERRGKLAGPQPDRHLQAAAHLGDAAAEPGDVVLRRAADRRGRPVSPASRVRHRLARQASWPSSPSTTAITVIFIVGWRWQIAAFLSLAALSLAAYNFPKIGVDYMPPLDEGSILDMPVTVPRASVAETADDLKARDAMLRRFPEVEMVVGKAGRADTPTDPSPLEMMETDHHAPAQGVLAEAECSATPTPSGRRGSSWKRWPMRAAQAACGRSPTATPWSTRSRWPPWAKWTRRCGS